jgi:glycosyltransferase involved in cell wall biosynthesis
MSVISIIIPVYNHAYTLRRTLESIHAQTYRPLEVIVVNDGSTDDFEGVVEEIKTEIQKDNLSLSLKIINQTNRGASAARNSGFKEANGHYVIFWDADTVGETGMIAKLKRALDEHPEASYAYSQFKFGWKKMKSQPFKAEDLKRYNYIDTTSLIRRGTLDSLPAGEPFDESLRRFQDWDLWLTLLEQGKTGIFVPEGLYTKIVHGRNGISGWLPRFMYMLPWKTKRVRAYEAARQIIAQKHFPLAR